MKTGSVQAQGSLFEQLRQTRGEATQAVASPRAGVAAHKPALAPASQEANAAPAPRDPLQTSLMVVAEAALKGQYATEEDARRGALAAIVENKWGATLDASQRAQMLKTLDAHLLDDPSFVRDVDQMLLLAARELFLK